MAKKKHYRFTHWVCSCSSFVYKEAARVAKGMPREKILTGEDGWMDGWGGLLIIILLYRPTQIDTQIVYIGREVNRRGVVDRRTRVDGWSLVDGRTGEGRDEDVFMG